MTTSSTADATTATTTSTAGRTKGEGTPFVPQVGGDLEHDVESSSVRWAMAPLDVTLAWTSAWRRYAGSAIERRVTPVDLVRDPVRFWTTAFHRATPEWSTPFEVAQEWPVARLLDFSTEPRDGVLPVVMLPPQAGHASTVVDHEPDQSQVRTALEQGLPV